MKEINEKIDKLADTMITIYNSAKDVNAHSIKRKEITTFNQNMLEKLVGSNDSLKSYFDTIYENLHKSLNEIEINTWEFNNNIEHFTNIISDIHKIKTSLATLDQEIIKLTDIVEEIKDDTDEIFTLALNASIVSSKYSNSSSVFDILANKLNEMSNFINQNLENIVTVVKPINDGIIKLINNNKIVLEKIESGHDSSTGFADILNQQKTSIDELLSNATDTGKKVDIQQNMLTNINKMIDEMATDAEEAINGSANVMSLSNKLTEIIDELKENASFDTEYKNNIQYISEQSSSISATATSVNKKSKTQLEFSINCVNYCDSLVIEVKDLLETTETLNKQSEENNSIADFLSKNLESISSLLNEIKTVIIDSNNTINQFNKDYEQINNIIEFLKDVLNSMNVIGIMSRIESARDPEEYSQFMTISENINKLQHQIEENIPKIEENIQVTHKIIITINELFNNISTSFFTILDKTNIIIKKLGEIIHFSIQSKKMSSAIISLTDTMSQNTKELRNSLQKLTEVVKKPIEGSALNIERGKKIVDMCNDIGEQLLKITSVKAN